MFSSYNFLTFLKLILSFLYMRIYNVYFNNYYLFFKCPSYFKLAIKKLISTFLKQFKMNTESITKIFFCCNNLRYLLNGYHHNLYLVIISILQMKIKFCHLAFLNFLRCINNVYQLQTLGSRKTHLWYTSNIKFNLTFF